VVLEEGASQGSAPLFIVSMSPPDYPSAWLRPRSAASVSPGKIIEAPPPARAVNFRIARQPPAIQKLVWPSRRADALGNLLMAKLSQIACSY
jgi:hypothetical protein